MSIQSVLIQRDDRIDLIAVIQRLPSGDTQAQPRMAATNHRLIAVVRENRLALTGHRHGQRIARRSHTISCRAADANNHVGLVHDNDPFRYGLVAKLAGLRLCIAFYLEVPDRDQAKRNLAEKVMDPDGQAVLFNA
jgi:hypothetical protein